MLLFYLATENEMSIKNWNIDDRPRDKLLAKGVAALTDAELLAIFLRTGTHGKSAVDLARDLLKEFGSLKTLLSVNKEQFCQAKGLGEAKYTQLQAVMEMARRHFKESLQQGDVLKSPDVTRAYLSAKLRGLQFEVFACLYLDNQNRVIEYVELFRGTINATNVYPREVAKTALYYNAAAIIFAHNHPSGNPEPSHADKAITVTLSQALALFDIRVLDHFIIGDGEPYSFAEHGLI
jgi:DNA repair protein RadC